MTRFWHRRIAEAGMFVAAFVVVLYFLPYFTTPGILSSALVIPDIGVILATLTFVVCFVTYLWTPKKQILPFAVGAYLFLASTAGVLIHSTGGAGSAFIALWIGLGVFASVFGVWGIAPLLTAGLAYAGFMYATENASLEQLIVLLIVNIVPIVASYIIFHGKSKRVNKNSSYHQLADELSQATSKAEVVIHAIDEGVIALDSKGVIELMNPAAAQIIGWGEQDATGLDFRSVLKLTDADNQAVTDANDPVVAVLTTGKAIHTKDFYATTGGGKRIILSLVVSPIGQVGQGVIIVFRDITREQAEEREQAEFISTASHEMRTPVASIEGYLGLALNPNTATIDEKAREFILKAHESAQHLGRLFQDLLDVSKAEDGRLSNHPGIVDVIAFMGDVVEALKPRADEKQLRLYYKPTLDDAKPGERMLSPVYYTNVDSDHLREVTSNLIENAIKYTPKGDVIVNVGGTEDNLVISIQDSGIGIAPEDIPHLFQKFYRIDNSATREIGGTGLGLYLCRRLAEVMGGRILVESEFGKGSTFSLELPRTNREDAIRMLDAAESNIETQPILLDDRPPVSAEQPESPLPPVPQTPSTPAPAVAPTPPTAPPPQQIPAATAPTLSTIEANPEQYRSSRRPGVQIPVRGQENDNQT